MKGIITNVHLITKSDVLDMGRLLITKARDLIVNESWDEWLIRQDEVLKKYTLWPFLAFMAVYFAYYCYVALSAVK